MILDVDATSRLPTATVKAVLRGRSTRVSKLKALKILSRRDDSDKHLLFAEVVRDPDEVVRVRSRAAKVLAASTHRRRSEVLVDQLRLAKDFQLIDGLLYALAFCGNRTAYDAIVRLESRFDRPFLKRRATFAKRLIAFRHHLEELELPSARKNQRLEPPEGANRFRLQPMPRATAGQARRDLVRGLHAVVPSAAQGWQVACRGERWAVLLNDELVGQGNRSALLRKKWILAVVGFADGLIEEYDARFYLLSQPDSRRPGRITLHGIDEVGDRVLGGVATLGGPELVFELESLKAEGMFPCRARGRLDVDRWRLGEFEGWSSGEAFRRPRRKRALRPITD